MRSSQSFGIHFTIRTDKVREGKVPVYACVTVSRLRSYIALKQLVEVKSWDNAKGALKGNREEFKSINNYLQEVRMAIGTCYQQLNLKGKMISAEAIKDAFLGTAKEVHTLSSLFEYHNETAASTLKWSTLKHYYVTQRYLVKFIQKQFKSADLYLHELDYKFIYDFETFLRNHKPVDHQKPLNNNGVMKHIIRVKKMVHLAIQLEWISKNPFANYKLKIQKVNREHLSEKELKTMENKVFDIDRIDMIRDLFVFCCYTGLTYVDVINLKHDNIVEAADGEMWVRTCRQKTDIPVNTPLLPKAVEILKKYKDNQRALLTNTIFPVVSNQKVNAYLKEIAEVCGIKKNITFHLARHTFATTVTLSNGVPIETVSKMLAHTKIATTQIYAKVLEKKISEDMAALRKKLKEVV
ncbi:site-specific recombinase XerD [Arcticibacter pallidicorallinus]|uniref:Site-specific recombinase XerD n=1 Tax=Arcticibacter pallidicorallinus TaxID=1259464 RepID=A0A2T0U476_9SPHI|nr:site-specific integrase [Arcticibacter pallidicorallinus]PRY52725.1 site-specific recombinase XerD [Arcticibacter pallidicorallinus]